MAQGQGGWGIGLRVEVLGFRLRVLSLRVQGSTQDSWIPGSPGFGRTDIMWSNEVMLPAIWLKRSSISSPLHDSEAKCTPAPRPLELNHMPAPVRYYKAKIGEVMMERYEVTEDLGQLGFQHSKADFAFDVSKLLCVVFKARVVWRRMWRQTLVSLTDHTCVTPPPFPQSRLVEHER